MNDSCGGEAIVSILGFIDGEDGSAGGAGVISANGIEGIVVVARGRRRMSTS